MNLVKSVTLVGFAMLFGGCTETLSPKAFDGRWGQNVSIAGNFFEITLVTSGNNVAASGDWCGEAAPCGTANGVGIIDGSQLHLDLAIAATFPVSGPVGIEHLDASIDLAGHLVGTARMARTGDPLGPASPIKFSRVIAPIFFEN